MTTEKSYRDSHAAAGYAAEYDHLYADGYFRQMWQEIETPILRHELLAQQRQGSVLALDFACGTGRVTELVASIFPQCVGIDVSAEMLTAARRRLPDVRFEQKDLTRQRQETGTLHRELPRFDLATAFRFFLNAEDSLRATALDALADQLRPGGVLIASFQWAASSPAGVLFRIRNSARRHEDPRTTTVAEISRLFGCHGFGIERVHRYGAWPWLGQHHHGPVAQRGMRTAETALHRIPVAEVVAQSFMVVARNLA